MQHDYDVANAAGIDFRHDINSLAAAIATQNTGSSSPAVTFGNMPWYSQLTGRMQRRNNANTAFIPQRSSIGSATIFYVSSAGSDGSADGLSSATAFRTIGGAVNYVSAWVDNAGLPVTIQVMDGIYAEQVALPQFVGFGAITVKGNTASPKSCQVSGATSGFCFLESQGAGWIIDGFSMVNSTGSCVEAAVRASLTVQNCDFALAGNTMLSARAMSNLAISSISISGSAACVLKASELSRCALFNTTVVMSGAPTVTSAFAWADKGGFISAAGVTFTGSVTGKRFDARANAIIDTAGVAAQTFFPGNVSGTVQSGGIYV